MIATETGDCHIMVAPPNRRDGVASMLVALGDARIRVSAVEPDGDSGLYRLTVADPHLAPQILERIGCRIVPPLVEGMAPRS